MSYADGSLGSNTPDVWRRIVGERIVGAFETYEHERTQIWLVTESGAAIVFSGATFWREGAEDVQRRVSAIRAELERKQAALRDVLNVAGETRP